MNVGQIFETHLGWAARGLGKQIGAMLEDIHARGKDLAAGAGAGDVTEMRAKLKAIYGNQYDSDIAGMTDEKVPVETPLTASTGTKSATTGV
jgi:DNA-directed RNA polymerase subunit beta